MYKVQIQYKPSDGEADDVKTYALSEDSCVEAIKGALQRFQEDTVYAYITSVRPVKTSAVLLIR